MMHLRTFFKLGSLILVFMLCISSFDGYLVTVEASTEKTLKLWYDEPAPMGNETVDELAANVADDGWEKWSLPLGNGYMGANVFGRTTTERIQITENSLGNPYAVGGLNNFSETYIDFNHSSPTNYYRDLDIRDAVAGVQYQNNGITYQRTYFTSYPDKVMVIRLTASQAGNLSFTLRPTIPYIKDYGKVPGDNGGKSGTVHAVNDTITLSGVLNYYNVQFEGQFKVIPTGGTMTAQNDANNDNGTITVNGATSAVILIAVGTNYQLESRVFCVAEADRILKLEGYPHPHAKVSQIMATASAKSYDQLLSAHKEDYQQYFSRVNLDLGGSVPQVTTDQLLQNYKNGNHDKYLEELYFQYGRYLLISSSRKGTLPPNLQGIWNRYDKSPWSCGYWHNINVQMNYWPVFNTNLAEMFESYADYHKAYKEKATLNATSYIERVNPSALSTTPGENGWAIGVAAWPYAISNVDPNGHSGPGMGALTSKMFWEYYDFTRDSLILEDTTYPAISSMSKFLSKVVRLYGDKYLTIISASPEQLVSDLPYITTGTAFDQQMIYENHKDTLAAAQLLDINEQIIDTIEEQIDKLDPVQVGFSGQIKEFREEDYYGDIGASAHRHISQLKSLYPGTLINSTTPAWMDAAKLTLNRRGDQSTGWAMAHRLNLWARAGDGNRSYLLYQTLLKNGTLTNLWDTHPPFQIDGNLGGTAGVAEMLLQSHEGYISLLPAKPDAWATGSYSGLVARGNFEISAQWANNQATRFEILSNNGGECKVKYYNLSTAQVKTIDGQNISFTPDGTDMITFNTTPNQTYVITNIPAVTLVAAPSNLDVTINGPVNMNLTWNASSDASSYNIYKAIESSPDYTLIASGVSGTSYDYFITDPYEYGKQCTYKVTASGADGRESVNGTTKTMLPYTTSAEPETIMNFDFNDLAIGNKPSGWTCYTQDTADNVTVQLDPVTNSKAMRILKRDNPEKPKNEAVFRRALTDEEREGIEFGVIRYSYKIRFESHKQYITNCGGLAGGYKYIDGVETSIITHPVRTFTYQNSLMFNYENGGNDQITVIPNLTVNPLKYYKFDVIVNTITDTHDLYMDDVLIFKNELFSDGISGSPPIEVKDIDGFKQISFTVRNDYNGAGDHIMWIDDIVLERLTVPTVIEATPATGATNVTLRPTVEIQFDAQMHTETINKTNIKVLNGEVEMPAADYNLNIFIDENNNTKLAITFNKDLRHNTTYTAVVSKEVKVNEGEFSLGLGENFTTSFTTIPPKFEVSDLTLKDSDGAEVGALNEVAGEKVYLNGTIKNNDSEPSQPYVIIIALTDANGALVSVKSLTDTLLKGESVLLSEEVQISPDATAGYKMKIFTWDSYDDIIPLCEKIVKP